MSNNAQQQLIEFVRAMTGQAQIIAVPRLLIDFYGGKLDWAAMTSQLMYLSNKNLTDEGWFVLPDKELTATVGITQATATACRAWLRKAEVIETQVKRVPSGTPMLHYKIDNDHMAKMVALLTEFIEKGITAEPVKRSDPYFENIATVCGMRPPDDDWSLLSDDERGQINRCAGQLRKMKEPPELILDYLEWWNANDWRGRKGQAPRPSDITANWQQLKKWLTGNRPAATPPGKPALNPGLAAVELMKGRTS
jgi:hypothetical protein